MRQISAWQVVFSLSRGWWIPFKVFKLSIKYISKCRSTLRSAQSSIILKMSHTQNFSLPLLFFDSTASMRFENGEWRVVVDSDVYGILNIEYFIRITKSTLISKSHGTWETRLCNKKVNSLIIYLMNLTSNSWRIYATEKWEFVELKIPEMTISHFLSLFSHYCRILSNPGKIINSSCK